jgi:hypothetical protein
MLALSRDKQKFYDPYALHVAIIDEILALFDYSVWSLRDLIRDIELVKMLLAHYN